MIVLPLDICGYFVYNQDEVDPARYDTRLKSSALARLNLGSTHQRNRGVYESFLLLKGTGWHTTVGRQTSMRTKRFEAPCSPATAGQGMFCLTAVLRSDCKGVYHFKIRSLSLQRLDCLRHELRPNAARRSQAAGNALAIAVQPLPGNSPLPTANEDIALGGTR
jgi:hypothetical protein